MTPRYAWAHLSCGCAYAFCGANQLAPEEGVGAHQVKSWSRINYDTLLAFRSERYQAWCRSDQWTPPEGFGPSLTITVPPSLRIRADEVIE